MSAATFRDHISSASIEATSAREKAWKPHHWTAIARHLGETYREEVGAR